MNLDRFKYAVLIAVGLWVFLFVEYTLYQIFGQIAIQLTVVAIAGGILAWVVDWATTTPPVE